MLDMLTASKPHLSFQVTAQLLYENKKDNSSNLFYKNNSAFTFIIHGILKRWFPYSPVPKA